jgi:hypothetical protein
LGGFEIRPYKTGVEMKQQLITLLLGEVAESLRGEVFKPISTKSAPVYSETAVPRQIIVGSESVTIDGRTIEFKLKAYTPDILLIQSITDVDNIFQRELFNLEEAIYKQAYRILEARGGKAYLSEEYSVFTVLNYEGEPEQFLVNAPVIASLLKSEKLELDSREVKYTLDAQIKYAKNDLAIIDWDGAFLFDPSGDVEEEIELLTLANLQLLRHRLLDSQLDQRLGRMAKMVPTGKKAFSHKELREDLRGILKMRMQSIAGLQRIEREIKLIGDWYSARLYNLAAGKFRIDDWRKSIQSKVDSLEDVYSVVLENFTVSAKHRVEWIQIIAFFFLQVGWFALIILEFIQMTRWRNH